MKKTASFLLVSLVSFSLGAGPSHAATTPELDGRIHEARQVLSEIMVSPDNSIPEELLAKCKAIAIYPNVLKGGFIIGARFGKGVVLAKDDAGKWSPVAFSTIGGGSWGLQIGGQMTDLIFVVMNERGLQGLLNTKFTLGADASVAAGPVGRGTQAATDLSLRAGILSYSRSRGLFGGVALDGSVVTQDNNSNTLYYGKPVTSTEILMGNAVTAQPSSRELIDALTQYSALWSKRMGAVPVAAEPATETK
jgi:lipid-binding SYLF domain-containing protein